MGRDDEEWPLSPSGSGQGASIWEPPVSRRDLRKADGRRIGTGPATGALEKDRSRHRRRRDLRVPEPSQVETPLPEAAVPMPFRHEPEQVPVPALFAPGSPEWAEGAAPRWDEIIEESQPERPVQVAAQAMDAAPEAKPKKAPKERRVKAPKEPKAPRERRDGRRFGATALACSVLATAVVAGGGAYAISEMVSRESTEGQGSVEEPTPIVRRAIGLPGVIQTDQGEPLFAATVTGISPLSCLDSSGQPEQSENGRFIAVSVMAATGELSRVGIDEIDLTKWTVNGQEVTSGVASNCLPEQLSTIGGNMSATGVVVLDVPVDPGVLALSASNSEQTWSWGWDLPGGVVQGDIDSATQQGDDAEATEEEVASNE